MVRCRVRPHHLLILVCAASAWQTACQLTACQLVTVAKPVCTCCCFVPRLQVLQLHADSTSASVSWADYSHGALSGSAAPSHSPVCGQQGPEFGDGDAADSPGSMSAMLTWAGAGMKQLASKLLGSSSLVDSQQVQAVQEATSLGCLCCHDSAM